MPAILLLLSAALNTVAVDSDSAQAGPIRPTPIIRLANAEPPPSSPTSPSPVPTIDSILQEQTDSEPDESTPAPTPAPIQPTQPPPALDSGAYDAQVLATARNAQAMRGPLDGGWMLATSDGRPLYRFQLADNGQGAGAEGAWRDLHVATPALSTGFIASVSFDGQQLMLRFYENGPDDLAVVSLKPGEGGAWAGQFWRRGVSTPVTFRRP